MIARRTDGLTDRKIDAERTPTYITMTPTQRSNNTPRRHRHQRLRRRRRLRRRQY